MIPMIRHSLEYFEQNTSDAESHTGTESLATTPIESERHSLDINAVLTYKNPKAEEYKALAKAEGEEMKDSLKAGISLGHRAASIWYNLFPLAMDQENLELFEQMENIRYSMEGKPFIDLGGGEFSAMETFAREHGAASYVNVDSFHPIKQLMENSVDTVNATDTASTADTEGTTGAEGIIFVEQDPNYDYERIIVPQDMLLFLSRMQPMECNFAVNGIDGFIISDDKYHKALTEELARVSAPGSLVFCANSVVVEYLEKNGFVRATDTVIGKFTEHSGIFRRV